ncbi:hypothetical protein [Candidatus Borrarchaeum sp.]|uniref:hypothetical protein n=1 Tax=Candidatus Borrarchaeum sp. TaxID=2846742 RepID=UPI00257BBA4D|nr:hypothetical protein [Candidatus Borrarchaeum sp.]
MRCWIATSCTGFLTLTPVTTLTGRLWEDMPPPQSEGDFPPHKLKSKSPKKIKSSFVWAYFINHLISSSVY